MAGSLAFGGATREARRPGSPVVIVVLGADMGAFAGSAALLCRERRSDTAVITVTMNNSCNLKCAHCYLQYSGADALLSRDVTEAIATSDASAVSIVGMEPLKNRSTAKELAYIVSRVKRAGKAVGFITNGINAHLLDAETVALVDWIDVSVDGTRHSYADLRGAPVAKLESGVEHLVARGVRQVNVLHTIHALNLANLPELMRFGRELGTGSVIVSPYSATRHEGRPSARLTISAQAFVDALEDTDCDLARCWLVLDLDWLRDAADPVALELRLRKLFSEHSVLFEDDPIHYGMIRVTYDGRVMTPREAMHTSGYHRHRPNVVPLLRIERAHWTANSGPV